MISIIKYDNLCAKVLSLFPFHSDDMFCLRGLRINYLRERDVYELSFYIFVAAGVKLYRSENVFIFFKNFRCFGKNILRQDCSNNGMRMFGQN